MLQRKRTKPGRERVRVLIPDAGNVIALPVVRALARLRTVDLWLMVDDAPAPGWQTVHKRGVFRRRSASLAQDAVEACARCAADVVFPVSEPGIRAISAARAAFAGIARLPLLPEPELLDLTSDKARLAEFAAAHGIPTPTTVVCEGGQFDAETLRQLRFPLLAKPAQGMGAVGILYLPNWAALAEFFESAAGESRWVLQEFVRGSDGGCSVLCRDGKILAHTVQRVMQRRTARGVVNDGIELRHDPKVLELVTSLMAALRFEGVAHCDVRHDAETGEVKLLEINPRFWGSLLGSVRAGVDFAALALATAFGEMPMASTYAPRRHYPATLALQLGVGSPRNWSRLPGMLWNSDLFFRLRDPYADILRLRSRGNADWRPRGERLGSDVGATATTVAVQQGVGQAGFEEREWSRAS